MMTVGVLDPTRMGSSTSTTTTTVIMTTSTIVVMTMISTRITRVDLRATTMEVEVAVEASLSRKILVRLSVSSARRWGIMQMNAQKRKLKDPTSPTLFKRGNLTTSMWRKSMRSLMQLLVSSNSILFQHLFFLILEHRIHSYQKHLLIEMGFQLKTLGVQ